MKTHVRAPKSPPARDEDFVGKKFGLLTVIKRNTEVNNSKHSHVRFDCVCDCGNTHVARASHLRACYIASCGCRKRGRPLGSGKTYTYEGRTLTLREWSEVLGFNLSTLTSRNANGWKTDRMLSEKPKEKSK